MLGAERAAEAVRETWRQLEEFNLAPQLALESLFVGSSASWPRDSRPARHDRLRAARGPASLVATLREAGVQRLVDVRKFPSSRRRGFSKTALAAALDAAGIEYVHARALGNPKPNRDLWRAGRRPGHSAATASILRATGSPR